MKRFFIAALLAACLCGCAEAEWAYTAAKVLGDTSRDDSVEAVKDRGR